MAGVMESEFDIRSHVRNYIVAQGYSVGDDFSDVFLVVGRVFAFPAVNVEIVQLAKSHQGLGGFRAVDGSVIARLVEEGGYTARVKGGVRYDHCIQLFHAKLIRTDPRACRRWV